MKLSMNVFGGILESVCLAMCPSVYKILVICVTTSIPQSCCFYIETL